MCAAHGWQLAQARFYTGIPDASDDPFWNYRYDRRRAELEKLIADKKSDYYRDKKALADPDEYRRVGAFIIPENARWQNLRKAAQHRDEIRAEIRAAVRRVLRRRGVRDTDFDPFIDRFMQQAEAQYADWPLVA